MHRLIRRTVVFAVLCAAVPCFAAQTERQYLSGKGVDDAVPWDFVCSAGMNANTPSTIMVPSNWELQGFGIYNYGRDQNRGGWPRVQGKYRRTFAVPAGWAGKSVSLVFDGVMTDTQAFINGEPAGPMHQGGFYRFRYDVTKLVKPGESNLIEVTVDDESANASVNNAERRGDYWNFGGIYRPVYLEAAPPVHIERVAIDARADGAFALDAYVRPGETPLRLSARLLDLQGRQAGNAAEAMLGTGQAGPARLATRLANPRQWTAETPNLYQVEVNVGTADGSILHTHKQRFGFRTIEVRRNVPAAPATAPAAANTPAPATVAATTTAPSAEGLFVNGQRILLKGANRHSFHPDSGRALSEAISREDILLMQSMNMNAVRMSHYPPDEHFLDLCDELGMYVLDELAGWHQKYDTPTGHRLVEQMVTRDVNHPCILFWDNGNEGGWNTDLDSDFAQWDPQKRPVLHPWDPFRGVDTKHYPVFTLHRQKAAGNDLYMPTEMLHGLYDGGAGASLDDYWKVIRESRVGGGGFIWALVDESVRRTDQNGRLDSKGNLAPDGIVGPYREKEGSFYTIKELWSPIVVTRQGDDFVVENRYGFLDAKDCTYTFEYRQMPRANGVIAEMRVAYRHEAKTEGSIPPGQSGKLIVPRLPPATFPANFEVMALTIKDPAGRELWTYTWPDREIAGNFDWLLRNTSSASITQRETAETLAVRVGGAGGLSLDFSKETGQIVAVARDGKSFSLSKGPRLFQGLPQPEPGARGGRGPAAALPALPPAPKLSSLTPRMEGEDLLITAEYEGDLRRVVYRVRPNGWLTMDYVYELAGPRDYFGIAFDYPESQVRSMRYLGEGPFRVWKNRLAGGTLGVWDKVFNDTSTGEPSPEAASRFEYPEFKGYYAGVRWAQLQTAEGPLTVLIDQGNGAPGDGAVPPLYLQVLTPRMPAAQNALRSGVNIGQAGLAVLHAIPPIGNKFDYANVTGPQAQRAVGNGEYQGRVGLYFGPLPK
jgi:hypothetical protein